MRIRSAFYLSVAAIAVAAVLTGAPATRAGGDADEAQGCRGASVPGSHPTYKTPFPAGRETDRRAACRGAHPAHRHHNSRSPLARPRRWAGSARPGLAVGEPVTSHRGHAAGGARRTEDEDESGRLDEVVERIVVQVDGV